MSNVKRMKNLDKLEVLLVQFPKGIHVNDVAEKLGWSRSKVYDYLNTLKLKRKAYYENGYAYPSKPSEKGLFNELAEDLGLTKEQLIELTKLGIIYGE